MAASASLARLGDDDALAGGEAVGLDHDRQRLRRRDRPCAAAASREAAVGGGRDAELGAEVLGEALRAFELGRGLGRAEGLDAGRRQVVGEARDQRRLGPDHDEADVVVAAERDDGRVVGDVERDASRRPRRCRHCRARSRACRAAGWPRSPRPARARGRRSRSGGRSCDDVPAKALESQPSIGLVAARPHVSSKRSPNKAGEIRGRASQRRPPGRASAGANAPEFSVSELVVRHQADAGGRLRLRAPARRDLGLPRPAFLRPLLFRAEGRQGQDRRRDLARHVSQACGSSRRRGWR